MTNQPSPACSGNTKEDAVSIEITDELCVQYREESGYIHQSQSDTTHQLTAAATVLAPILDKRPTRSQVEGLFGNHTETSFSRLAEMVLFKKLDAAGFVRDDPAPVRPKFETVAECEAWLDEHDKGWTCERDRYGNWFASRQSGWTIGIGSRFQLEALNDLIAAIAKDTP